MRRRECARRSISIIMERRRSQQSKVKQRLCRSEEDLTSPNVSQLIQGFEARANQRDRLFARFNDLRQRERELNRALTHLISLSSFMTNDER